MHVPEETIVALSTPPGRGGLAVLRLSGPDALAFSKRVMSISPDARIDPGRAILGWLCAPGDGRRLDRGYLTWHAAGRSYTGEEVVELSCHGSPVLVQQILEALVAAGARPASAGEFTYRAVLNGRIDLAQAEGVRDLIAAPTAAAARAALSQVRGELSRRLGALSEELVEIISRLEAGLEFAEEPDVPQEYARIGSRLRSLDDAVQRFLATYRRGRLLREGARVVLAGRPNAGKSSLFNRLLRTPRALVSDEAGTTRDFISERVDLDGIAVTLIDTAGLRVTALGVEAQGVERSERLIGEADSILLLCGCDEEPDALDEKILREGAGRCLLVASKSDLLRREPPAWATLAMRVSALTGEGIDALRAAVVDRLTGAPRLCDEEILIGEARHHDALTGCSRGLGRALESMRDGASEEIVLVDLHAALRHLGEITGAAPLDSVYERIFSTFCIGK